MAADQPTATHVAISVTAFSLAAASLLIVNKAALKLLPAPSFITCSQFTVATVFVLSLKWSGSAAVDDFEWSKVGGFGLPCSVGTVNQTPHIFTGVQFSRTQARAPRMRRARPRWLRRTGRR